MPSSDPFLPPQATPPEPPRDRPRAARELEVGEPLRRDAARAAIALIIALLLHAGAWYGVPDDLASAIDVLNDPPPRRSIELSFEPTPEVPPEEQRYVDTNPDKPSNRPDETPNISDRDQQAAQETDEGEIDPDNNPRSEGEEADSMRVIEGNLTDPEPYVPPAGAEAPSQEPTEAAETKPPAEVGAPPPAPTTPDFLAANPDTQEGIGSYLRDAQPDTQPTDGRAAEVNAVLNDEVAEASANQAEARQATQQGQQVQPRPRPRLSPQVIAGPTLQNFTRAEEVGVVGLDAFRSDMGEYLREVLGVISLHWQNLARQTYRSTGEQRATVVVEFWINQDGTVQDARVVESSGVRAAELICIDGVTGRAPYRPWTEDMKKTLGERQVVRIRFLYY